MRLGWNWKKGIELEQNQNEIGIQWEWNCSRVGKLEQDWNGIEIEFEQRCCGANRVKSRRTATRTGGSITNRTAKPHFCGF